MHAPTLNAGLMDNDAERYCSYSLYNKHYYCRSVLALNYVNVLSALHIFNIKIFYIFPNIHF